MKTEVSPLTKRSNTAINLASELTTVTSCYFMFQNKVLHILRGFQNNILSHTVFEPILYYMFCLCYLAFVLDIDRY